MSPRSKNRFQSYVICTTPRSGSTLLCRMLAGTRLVGHPDSHFHAPSLRRWLAVYGLGEVDFSNRAEALHAVRRAALDKGREGGEIFGLRLQRGSFDYLMRQLAVLYPDAATQADRIRMAFGECLFVHLSRNNKLEQAVSRVLAEQTGLWHRAADGSELERLGPPQPPRFDAEAIAHHLSELRDMDRAWRAWFDEQKLDVLQISYEDLSADPRRAAARFFRAMGFEQTASIRLEVPTARLSNSINKSWVQRFQASRAGTGIYSVPRKT